MVMFAVVFPTLVEREIDEHKFFLFVVIPILKIFIEHQSGK